MIEKNYSSIFQGIRLTLEDEYKLREDYCVLSSEERRAMTKFDTGEIEKLTSKKEEILQKLETNSLKIKELISALPDAEPRTISELAKAYARKEDRRVILQLVDKVRRISKKTKLSSLELKELSSFSLSMIHSLLSIIWSGTLGITKSYGKRGNLKESFHPLGSRTKTTLKEA